MTPKGDTKFKGKWYGRKRLGKGLKNGIRNLVIFDANTQSQIALLWARYVESM